MFSDLITKGENQTNKKQRGPEGTFRHNGYTYDADGNAGFTHILISKYIISHINYLQFLVKKRKKNSCQFSEQISGILTSSLRKRRFFCD